MSESRSPDPEQPVGPLTALRAARPSPSVEQRIVDGAMGRALAPRRRPVAPMLIAAAAAAALVWFVARPTPPPAEAPSDPPAIATASNTPAPPQAVTHQMTHGKGAVFEVKRHGPDHTEVQLTAGQAEFQVDPLPPGGVFAVQTPYARVEVVGTAFSVNVANGCAQIAVSEGRVRVRQGERIRFVTAGQQHRACPQATAGEAWVQAGLADLVAGRTDQAIAQLERYLSAYPRGPLAEDALYNLVLAARQIGGADLTAACQRYLDRFPHGARADQVSTWLP